MRARTFANGLLLLILASSVQSQDRTAITSLRGIELGSELKTAARSECPMQYGVYIYPDESDDRQCWTSLHSSAFRSSTPLFAINQVHNVPRIQGMLSTVGTSLIDGRIEAVESLFARSIYEAMREALVQRYGRFDMEEPITLQFRTGARITVRRATWSRPEALLQIDERVEAMDNGAISLYSKKWLDAAKARQMEITERAKSKL